MSFEIVAPDGTVFTINSEGLFDTNISGKGYLTLYADGTWARTTTAGTTTATGRWDTNLDATILLSAAQIAAGARYDWFGTADDTSDAIAVQMLQSGSSIDILLANDPDTSGLATVGLWVPDRKSGV